MKKIQLPLYLFAFCICLIIGCTTATDSGTKELATKTASSNGYEYQYVENDPSKTRIYTLDNGLKVYLSVYKNEPRIQTYIPVKAGGKFDPANSTGLAHYLEHMMFKGNDVFGTKDWDTEKVFIDSIENMYEHYRTLTDPAGRKAFYEKIDEVSNEASKYAIANEYDKMCSFIGASGTNAYTTEDRTVYVNNIPSNQIDNWLDLESTRFKKIVNRLFHTELEAVYEEKNRSLDNDGWKVYENLYKAMFKKHKYGTQTVIGTIEHLKNPSIKDIREYFDKYYVPNNVAICMSGDLDPDETIKKIDKYFGAWERKELTQYTPAVEEPLTTQVVEILGPDAEGVTMGFRFGGSSSDDIPKAMMVDYILDNSVAGLINLNLVQKQKVLSAGCYIDQLNDYSIHTFYGNPREGQSLNEIRDEILAQIEKVKNGEFEDWLLEAIINDFKKSKMSQLESNNSRANSMVMAFTNNMDWKDYISLIPKMEKVTKEDIMNFAKANYGSYIQVNKKTGEDPNKLKVEKPAITKVNVDRDTKSPFYQAMYERKAPSIKPVFIDYEKDVKQLTMKSDIPVLYNENKENELFTLYYLLETGRNENNLMQYALDYLKYLGTEEMSPEDLKKEFYKLGASFNVSSSDERTFVSLSGLQEKMVPAMQLFESLLANPKGNPEKLQNLISDSHKERSDIKKNKSRILWGGLMNYAKYGPTSPFTNVLSNEELNALDSEVLLDLVRNINKMEHKVMYYGPMSSSELIKTLDANHQVPDKMNPVPERRIFAANDTDDPSVFWTNYDMVQAEIVMQSKGPDWDPSIAPESRLYNEYFGGGMSGIVFQEIREAQGLAYSVFSAYQNGSKQSKPDVLMAYIGTQADKQEEAMTALMDLINNMPESPQNFENAKKSILEKIESERITKTRVLFNYLDAKDKGLDYDLRKDIYSKVKDMSFENLKSFHQKYVKDKKYNISVLGDRSKLNFSALSKYGKVTELNLDELFGYGEHNNEVLN